MEDKELWKTFEKTGSVVDYLRYKNLYEKSRADCDMGNKKEMLGEKTSESKYHSDGHDTVCNTYR